MRSSTGFGYTPLQDLGLHNTEVTDAGVAALQKALPGVQIIR